ncbi:hypothetical protein IEO21_01659 [Rhodonia placenta]|uniref:Conserved oligomeric Golgi complex subunit 8 n=1 Tax=Rhodonia placenta TaxID=104341 RepID=A0A8H7U5U6_9APHY|nr:hypothetical protein IEO21_01659 [Postia placenta]
MAETTIANGHRLSDLPSLGEILASSPHASATAAPTWSSPDTTSYLDELTSLPLCELESQPTELSSSSAQLTNALTTLCHTSYPTFLSIHATTSTLASSLSSLSSSLDALVSSLPALESSAASFAVDARAIQKDRRKAALVLEHHDKLYDALSLPVLLDSCVRNHSYAEALLLAQHAAGLATRFPADPLVQSVKAECDARVQAMLAQLLRMLSEQAKLPALFRAVGFLRKMAVLDEPELALAFLTGRGVYLDGLFKTLESERKGVQGDAEHEREAYARYLKRYVDLWREGVYDVITQYTSIFLDRAPSTSAAAHPQLHALLTTFTNLHLQTLLALLQEMLPLIPDPSLLTSLLTQLTYCANSFARVGLDFKGLLAPIFVDAVQKGIEREFNEAAEALCNKIRTGTDGKRPASSISGKKPSQYLVAPSSLPSPPLPTAAQLRALSSGPPNVPPPLLVSYPPLAVYLNAVLTALNGLRLLAPVELLSALLRALDTSLAKGLSALLALTREPPWADAPSRPSAEDAKAEEGVVGAAATVYARVLVPFIRRALVEGVYGVSMGKANMPVGKDLKDVLDKWEGAGAEDGVSRDSEIISA